MKKRISMLLILVLVMSMIGIAPIDGSADAAGKVRLNKTSLSLKVGSVAKLVLKKAKGKVKWKSSKSSVASVTKKGVVKAKKAGSAAIVATHKGKNYFCNVTVIAKSKPTETESPISTEEPTAEPVVTIEPTAEPTLAPTPTPTVAPTSTPMPTVKTTPAPVPTSTPTPKISDTQKNRLTLISYLKSRGSKDTLGNWAIEDKTSKSNGLIMTKASTDGELLMLQCGTGMKTSDGSIMTSVVTVVFGVEQDLLSANCIVKAQSSYGTTLENSTVVVNTSTSNIVSENNHLSWSVDEKSGSLFDDDELCKLADTSMDLFYPWMNILLTVKCGGMKLESLGFGS